MAVVMQHFSSTAQQHADRTIPSLVPHGYLAVDLFFILSGFIMAYTYLDSFERRVPCAYKQFLIKRIGRILPLNLFALLVVFLTGVGSKLVLGRNIIYTSDQPLTDFIANIFMLQGLGIGKNLNAPSWSVSTECVAYLLFPVFSYLVSARQRSYRVIVSVVSLGAIGWLASLHGHASLATESVDESLIRCLAEFSVGMSTFYIYRSGKVNYFRKNSVSLTLIFILLFLMMLRIDLLVVLCFPPLILSFAQNKGAIAKWMSNRFFYFLGVVSFSLYLLHQVFRPIELTLLQSLHPQAIGMMPALLFAFTGSLSVIPFAWFAYRFVEKPGRGFIRNFAKKTSPALSGEFSEKSRQGRQENE